MIKIISLFYDFFYTTIGIILNNILVFLNYYIFFQVEISHYYQYVINGNDI